MYSAHEAKSVLAVRFIRTLKNKIYMHMTAISKNVCIDILDEIAEKCINSYHRKIRMKSVNTKSGMYIEYGCEYNNKYHKFKV